jgi:hypothetical protein
MTQVECPLCGNLTRRCLVCGDCYCTCCDPAADELCCSLDCGDKWLYGIFASRSGGFEIHEGFDSFGNPELSLTETKFATREAARKFVQVLQRLDRE